MDIICTRWKIEEDFQQAKGLTGLDEGQVTSWISWMRWSLISLLAAAVLTVTHARSNTTDDSNLELAPASPRELLTILRVTAVPAPRRDLQHVLTWSAWRRHHQHRAAACHRRWNNITAEAST
ncbi:hypothetical protein [Streptomyces sp. SCL15-6]|uniref:hypothetical protein n=1 Tax=Streptomyces sp. SCL15-6 TaxID=2967222 RepID=UPI002966E95A|nr:hypothetical protein [Streptomyces sp. SCL15-6]